jgi:hypothetical protein
VHFVLQAFELFAVFAQDVFPLLLQFLLQFLGLFPHSALMGSDFGLGAPGGILGFA